MYNHPFRRLGIPANFLLLLAGGLIILGTTNTLLADDNEKPLKNNLMLMETALPSAEFNTKVRTITWPVGYTSKVHSHAGPGPRYVLKGIVQITENGQSQKYRSGDTFWYSAQFPHQAQNVATVPTQVLIIELLPKE